MLNCVAHMSLLEFFDLVFGANKKQQEDYITLKKVGEDFTGKWFSFHVDVADVGHCLGEDSPR